jgi:hypothetical protein
MRIMEIKEAPQPFIPVTPGTEIGGLKGAQLRMGSAALRLIECNRANDRLGDRVSVRRVACAAGDAPRSGYIPVGIVERQNRSSGIRTDRRCGDGWMDGRRWHWRPTTGAMARRAMGVASCARACLERAD